MKLIKHTLALSLATVLTAASVGTSYASDTGFNFDWNAYVADETAVALDTRGETLFASVKMKSGDLPSYWKGLPNYWESFTADETAVALDTRGETL